MCIKKAEKKNNMSERRGEEGFTICHRFSASIFHSIEIDSILKMKPINFSLSLKLLIAVMEINN